MAGAAKLSQVQSAYRPVRCGKVIAAVMVGGSYESGMGGALSYTEQLRGMASEWWWENVKKPRGWGILLQRQ